MTWYEIIGLISALVSFIAALYTTKYSSIVKQTKNEILSLFKVVKFSNVNEITISVLDHIKKIAHKQNIARGTNIDEIVNSLNNYYEKVFKLKSESEVVKSEDLNQLIASYRSTVDLISLTARTDQPSIINLFNQLYEITLNIDHEFNKLTKNIFEK